MLREVFRILCATLLTEAAYRLHRIGRRLERRARALLERTDRRLVVSQARRVERQVH